MAEKTPIRRLRTIDDLNEANEETYQLLHEGKIDAKQGDGRNTVLKMAYNLNVKTRMDLLKIVANSQIKKLDLPFSLIPSGLTIEESVMGKGRS